MASARTAEVFVKFQKSGYNSPAPFTSHLKKERDVDQSTSLS